MTLFQIRSEVARRRAETKAFLSRASRTLRQAIEQTADRLIPVWCVMCGHLVSRAEAKTVLLTTGWLAQMCGKCYADKYYPFSEIRKGGK